MRRFRFTIGRLIVVIALTAAAIAALRESTAICVQVVFSATIVIFLTSILLAVHRRESSRAYWLGFALAGVVYGIVSEIPTLEPRLVTSPALTYLASRRPDFSQSSLDALASASPANMVRSVAFSRDGRSLAISGSGNVRLFDVSGAAVVNLASRSPDNFNRIGHSLLSLLLAVAGGCSSRFLYHRSKT
jgi:hypothetical protein